MSNPVFCARSKRLGGFQYRGTKRGSVSPKGIVNKLVCHILRRSLGSTANPNLIGLIVFVALFIVLSPFVRMAACHKQEPTANQDKKHYKCYYVIDSQGWR